MSEFDPRAASTGTPPAEHAECAAVIAELRTRLAAVEAQQRHTQAAAATAPRWDAASFALGGLLS